jgi:hypothetical protein
MWRSENIRSSEDINAVSAASPLKTRRRVWNMPSTTKSTVARQLQSMKPPMISPELRKSTDAAKFPNPVGFLQAPE